MADDRWPRRGRRSVIGHRPSAIPQRQTPDLPDERRKNDTPRLSPPRSDGTTPEERSWVETRVPRVVFNPCRVGGPLRTGCGQPVAPRTHEPIREKSRENRWTIRRDATDWDGERIPARAPWRAGDGQD